jgi:hypothetical protein
MTLAEFVTARLDEDEAAAGAGARRAGMQWHAEPQAGTPGGLVIDDYGLVGSTGGRHAAEHIARHDPARALREVAAGRAHLAAYQASVRSVGEGLSRTARAVVEADAAIWSDHPDYARIAPQ